LTPIFAVLAALLLAAPDADFQTEFVNGLKALDRHNLAVAKADLQTANRMQPSNPRVWVALAQTYWRLKQPALAAEAAGNAEKLGAEDPVTLRALAFFYAEQKKFLKAGDFEAKCAAKDTQDQAAVTRAMLDYLQADQPKKAIDLALATTGWESRADIRNLLGKAYETDGQILKTIPELREAVVLKPDEESYFFDLLQTLLNHYNFDVAIKFAEVGRKRFPGSAQIALAAGVAYYGAKGSKQTDAAITAFLDAIALDPTAEQPYLFLVRLLNDAPDKLPLITQRFVEYQEKNPRNYLGYYLHAKALLAVSEPEQAESLLRQSIALNAKFWESHYELGLLAQKKGDLVEAEKEFRRSTELNPSDPVGHYHLFRVLAGLGKAQQAQAELAVQRRVSAEHEAYLAQHVGGIKRFDVTIGDPGQATPPAK
jgi:tetratricopeptide (TPR) repeat protein